MNIVSKQVQDPELDLGAAFSLINSLQEELLSMRGETDFDDQVKKLMDSCEIEPKEKSRVRKAPKKHDEFVQLDYARSC